MRYTLLLHYEEHDEASLNEEAMEQGQDAFASYAATLQAAGILLAAEVLQPSSVTTTLRMRDGSLQVQDGPFAGRDVVAMHRDGAYTSAAATAFRKLLNSWKPVPIVDQMH